jgi:2-C-methyl-D-erythritol 4-phosphate cytidylyltransferase
MVADDLSVVLVGAGASTRMAFDKVWADLAGRPVLAHVLDLARQVRPREVIVVVAQDRLSDARRLAPDARVVAGGARRRDSVRAGLAASSTDWLAIHDVARVLALPGLFVHGVHAAQATGAAVPVVPVKDTIKRAADGHVRETLPRAELLAVQTPPVCRRDILEWALDITDEDVTDEATLVERLGIKVAVFPGHEENFKITTPLDFVLARLVLERRAAERGDQVGERGSGRVGERESGRAREWESGRVGERENGEG